MATFLLWSLSGIGLALLAAVLRLVWLLGSIASTLKEQGDRLDKLEDRFDDHLVVQRGRYRA